MKDNWAEVLNRRSFLSGVVALASTGVRLGSVLGRRIPAREALIVGGAAEPASGDFQTGASAQPVTKKICLLGAAAVGKRTLVRSFSGASLYDDKYLTTVGVKIDKQSVAVGNQKIMLILWNVAAADDFQTLRPAYLKGAAGFLLVVDGTRRRTLETALDFYRGLTEGVKVAPSIVVMFNKDDLSSQWEMPATELEDLAARNITVVRGSAKTGIGVVETFTALAAQTLHQ